MPRRQGWTQAEGANRARATIWVHEMGAETVDIDRALIKDLHAGELARFVQARPRSMLLRKRARKSMPDGVPMAWMAGLYDHPPLFVAEGDGAYFVDIVASGRRS